LRSEGYVYNQPVYVGSLSFSSSIFQLIQFFRVFVIQTSLGTTIINPVVTLTTPTH